jgi:hypothetical protein
MREAEMKKLAQYLSLGVFGIVTMAPTSHAQESLGRIRMGAPFPDVDLPALADGKRTTVKLFRGKPVVLIVFASW